MDYQKLKGNTLNIKGNEVFVEKIELVKNEAICSDSNFLINEEIRLNSFDIGMLLNSINAEEIPEPSRNPLKRFKEKYGLFLIRDESDLDVLFQDTLKITTYGFHKSALTYELHFLGRKYILEFVFNDKKLFESGEMYDFLLTPTKLF